MQNPPTWTDRVIDTAILVGLAVLILIGFATSYRTLRDLAQTHGGYPPWLAPAVPLSFDLGIVVLSLKVARAAREGRTAPVMRLLVAGLSTATVIANAAAATTPTARLFHAVPPAMFVICFESVIITARRRALEDRGLLPQPLPRIRAVRWALAFPSTWKTWRHMVLTDAAPAPADPPTPPAPEPSAQNTTAAPRSRRGPNRTTPDDTATVLTGTSSRQPTGRRQTPGRDDAARTILEAAPTIPAPELALRLTAAGWPVSPRTAQRLRATLRGAPLQDRSTA